MFVWRNVKKVNILTEQLSAYEKVLTNKVVESTAQEQFAFNMLRKKYISIKTDGGNYL